MRAYYSRNVTEDEVPMGHAADDADARAPEEPAGLEEDPLFEEVEYVELGGEG